MRSMAQGVSRRQRCGAVVGVLVALALAVGGWQPASGDVPEGTEGTTVNVTPSDDLPAVADVAVEGVGFFSEGSTTVSVAQCVEAIGSCAAATQFVATQGMFSGTITVSRMLTLSDIAVDCAGVACSVRADGGFVVASHHLSFSRQQPTTTTTAPRVPPVVVTTATTTRPAVTTTRPSTTIAGPAATTTLPPARVATTTTTVIGPTTSTVQPVTTSSTAPTTSSTTTTAPPPPAAGDQRPPLVAVTSKNQPSGPPGGGLRVEGSGYTCETVYFFFDGTRVGSATPDGFGHVSNDGLSVPGNAGKGRHAVTSSCDPSGATVEQTSFFDVLPVAVHRPAFVTSLPLPHQVSLDPGQLMISAAVAIGAILLIAFPYELFNSTM